MAAAFTQAQDRAQAPPSARERLLAAAEGLLLAGGSGALTTRAICGTAGTNIAQISYYFGGLEGLLDALLTEELAAVSRAFEAIDFESDAGGLGSLSDTLLDALRTPAPYTRGGYAAVAIEAIHRSVSSAMRARTGALLDVAHARYRAALARQLPHLDADAIRFRLSAVIVAAMSMLPRGTGRTLLLLGRPAAEIDEDLLLRHLASMALAIWQAPQGNAHKLAG